MILTSGSSFADYASFSMPLDRHDEALEGVLPVLDEIGCYRDREGLYRAGSGTVMCSKLPARGLGIISATGHILTLLRAQDLLGQFLHSVASVPHNVTRLDASMDLPLYSPPVLASLYKLANNKKIKLSRKSVRPEEIMGPVLYEPPSSRKTGTLYLGSRKAEISAAIYDKRQEVHKRTGVDPGSDLLRIEARIRSGMSPSVRDVYEPTPIFHRFMQPSIVHGYDGPEWVCTAGEGFSVPRRDLPLGQRVKTLIEVSPDLARLSELVAEGGPPLHELAVALLAKRLRSGHVLH